MSEWQPIASAPKDATKILIWADQDGCEVAFWSAKRGTWIVYMAGDPWDHFEFDEYAVTYWQPLPSPPSPASRTEP